MLQSLHFLRYHLLNKTDVSSLHVDVFGGVRVVQKLRIESAECISHCLCNRSRVCLRFCAEDVAGKSSVQWVFGDKTKIPITRWMVSTEGYIL